jgi:predicted Fe-S protein YdhL (DUF1289 family)
MKCPCIDVCRYEDDSGWCFGCGLLKRERKRWKKLGKAERASVAAALPGRLAALAASGHVTGAAARRKKKRDRG